VLAELDETWYEFAEVEPAVWRPHALHIAIEAGGSGAHRGRRAPRGNRLEPHPNPQGIGPGLRVDSKVDH